MATTVGAVGVPDGRRAAARGRNSGWRARRSAAAPAARRRLRTRRSSRVCSPPGFLVRQVSQSDARTHRQRELAGHRTRRTGARSALTAAAAIVDLNLADTALDDADSPRSARSLAVTHLRLAATD